jgi:hypothetical protein
VAKTVDGVTTDYVLDGSTGLTTGPAEEMCIKGWGELLHEALHGWLYKRLLD